MGTRSLTHVKNDDNETFVTIYRQMDGYPSVMGADIKTALGGKTLVNGYTDPATQINGMGCAAAMLIAAIKTGCGGVYIVKPDTTDSGEEYVYTLTNRGDEIGLKIQNPEAVIYDGTIAAFDPEMEEPEDG